MCVIAVAPYMGAWIETFVVRFTDFPVQVAPYMGAWIETNLLQTAIGFQAVAPYMGAWIETELFEINSFPHTSLPIWERGLKLVCSFIRYGHTFRRSLYGSVD